jgi:hypothetical protein
MDFHPRGTFYHPRRLCFSLGSSRLSRISKFSVRGRTYVYYHTYYSQECHSDIYVLGVYVIRELKGDMLFSADEEKFKLKYLW